MTRIRRYHRYHHPRPECLLPSSFTKSHRSCLQCPRSALVPRLPRMLRDGSTVPLPSRPCQTLGAIYPSEHTLPHQFYKAVLIASACRQSPVHLVLRVPSSPPMTLGAPPTAEPALLVFRPLSLIPVSVVERKNSTPTDYVTWPFGPRECSLLPLLRILSQSPLSNRRIQ